MCMCMPPLASYLQKRKRDAKLGAQPLQHCDGAEVVDDHSRYILKRWLLARLARVLRVCGIDIPTLAAHL